MEQPKYQLIVKVSGGVVVRDRPAPQARGANKMRAEPVGKMLLAHSIIDIDGVDYAGLIPQNPLRPEWVRVAEADHSIEYVEVIPLTSSDDTAIAQAIFQLAAAVEKLGNPMKNTS